MKPKNMILPMVCCIPLLSSCVSPQPTDNPLAKQTWNIKPVYKVNNVAADNPNTLYQLGRYYQGQRRYELAAESYHKALVSDGSFVEAHNGLGVIYSMQGRYDEAVTEFRAAIVQAPKAGHLYNNLGHALYLQGAYAEAVTALEQAATLDPGNQRTLNNLGLAYAKAGEVDKSRQVFAEAAKPVSSDSIVAAPKAPEQTSVSQPASVAPGVDAGPVITTEQPHVQTLEPSIQALGSPVQTLALPKDRGVISSAPVVPVAITESRVETAQVAPDVYAPSERAEPVRVVATEVTTEVATKAATEGSTAMVHPAPVAQTDFLRLHLEVSNGNGVIGMARKVSNFLQESGYAKAHLTNRKPFAVQTTQIQYRSGYQAEAEQLRTSLPGYTGMVQSNSLRADINLRVVLGRDMMQHTAYFSGNALKLRFARNGLDS